MSKQLIEQLRRLGDPLISTDYEMLEQAARRIEELERTWLSPETYETLMEERKELLADNARLRESTELLLIARQIGHYRDEWDMLKEALASTPEQSLAEYRNKVIEECAAKCKDKHVNGNWMYDHREECEAAILDMKEQP